MTWNVQHASATRSQRQAAWIASQPADVIILTEVAPTDGGMALIRILIESGFTTIAPLQKGVGYQTLVASRVGDIEPCPQIQTSHLPGRCVAARLNFDGCQTIGIVGLYVPSRGNRERRNVDKKAFQNAVTDLLPQLAGLLAVDGPILIAGDLNVVEPNHRPHHQVFGAWEYDFYKAFARAGFVDAFRHLHPELLDHSWYGRRSGDGYRFDHIFCSNADSLADCQYHHEPRNSGLSDHSAMTASIDFCSSQASSSGL
jgi:exodeoxyribonuclease III